LAFEDGAVGCSGVGWGGEGRRRGGGEAAREREKRNTTNAFFRVG